MFEKERSYLHKEPRLYKQIDALYKWKHNEYFAPPFVEVSPVSYCNQNCKFCYTHLLWEKSVKLPDETFLSIIDSFKNMNVKGLRLQGIGEPTLHPLLPKVINRAGKYNIDTALTTNGVKMNAKFLDECLANLFSIKISVIDSDPKRYADFHRVNENHWKKVIENIKYATNLKSRNNFKCVIHTTIYAEDSTYEYLKNMVEFCKNIGFDLVTISNALYSPRTPDPISKKPAFKKFKNHTNYLKSLEADILSLAKDNFEIDINLRDAAFTTKNKPYVDETKKINCPGINFSTMIDAKGYVYPCWRYWGKPEYAYGNVIENSFEEIWKSENRKTINNKMKTEFYSEKTCSPCAHRRINEQLTELANNGNGSWENFLT